MTSFEETGKYGKELVDTGLASFAAVTKSLQAITAETTEYSRKSLEQGAAVATKLASSASPQKALEIQAEYVKSAHEAFVAQATRLGELYAELAKDAYKPFESVVARAS